MSSDLNILAAMERQAHSMAQMVDAVERQAAALERIAAAVEQMALAHKPVVIPAHPRHDVVIGPGREPWGDIKLDPKRTR